LEQAQKFGRVKMKSEVKYGDKSMTISISHGKLKDEIHGCMDSKS
jgi:hypothetical protein